MVEISCCWSSCQLLSTVPDLEEELQNGDEEASNAAPAAAAAGAGEAFESFSEDEDAGANLNNAEKQPQTNG